ncbi:MAG TPA: winged helix-turn-helix domain-containing protein [Gammaproteobacteria bacterium]|nr:winged helix-turn-helix domain-containing protein [Gammaproteobacteria bacterium]
MNDHLMHVLVAASRNAPLRRFCSALRKRNMAVDRVSGSRAMMTALKTSQPDLLILAALRDYPRLLARLRQQSGAPVLVLHNLDRPSDRIRILNAGADDCVAVSVPAAELAARVRALHRRQARQGSDRLTHGDLCLEPAAFRLTVSGREQPLARREFAVLQTLLENAGKVVSHRHLEQSVYEWRDELASNALEVHIHNLRKKLGAERIRTIRGVGYMIEA